MQAKRPGWFRATLAKAFLALALFPCLVAINQPAAYAANCTPIISYSGAYTIETFTATSGCSWTTPLNVFTADVLVVGAGGGAGGGAFDNLGSKSGGGGGGGVGSTSATSSATTQGGNGADGVVTLSATITPTTNGYQVASAVQNIFVKQRTSLR